MTQRLRAAVILAVLVIPVFVLAHSPTPNDLAIIAQVQDPTTGTQPCGGGSSPSIATTPGKHYIVVAGSGTVAPSVEISSWELTETGQGLGREFLVHKDGTITEIASGTTAHLLYHENVSISGASNAFYAAVEWRPRSGGTAHAFDHHGDPKMTLSPFTLSGEVGIIANFTGFSGVGCGSLVAGHLFDGNATLVGPDPPQNVSAVAISQSAVNVSWNESALATSYNVSMSGWRQDDWRAVGETASLFDVVEGLRGSTLYCFRVVAKNDLGSSAPSSVACAKTHRAWMPLSGGNGTIFGGDRAALASDVGVSELSLQLLWAIIIVFTLAAVGFTMKRTIGAGVGAIGGIIICVGFDLIPLWLIFLLAVIPAGLYVVIRARSAGGGT